MAMIHAYKVPGVDSIYQIEHRPDKYFPYGFYRGGSLIARGKTLPEVRKKLFDSMLETVENNLKKAEVLVSTLHAAKVTLGTDESSLDRFDMVGGQ